MQTRKTIIAAALVWMAGLLGIILFQDVFAGSLLGAVLGILMVIVTLAATYFMVDGMLMLKQQSEEQQDLLQRAYQDKLLELRSREMERLNGKKGEPATIDDASFEQYKESINKTTLQAAKLIVKQKRSMISWINYWTKPKLLNTKIQTVNVTADKTVVATTILEASSASPSMFFAMI